jgi:phosphoribosylanthranilate isomerase
MKVKICGIRTELDMMAAIDSGAHYAGFMFWKKSCRYVSYAVASAIEKSVGGRISCVGVFVNPSFEEIEAAISQVPINLIQLHGDEKPERILKIREQFNCEVIKAIPIATKDDIGNISDYEEVADYLLCDAKVAFDALNPQRLTAYGGIGRKFDWSLLAGRKWKRPWFLAGGLDASNIQEAVRITGTKMIDLSSGVEETRGIKSVAKIRNFMQIAKTI